MATPKYIPKDVARFWSKVDKTPHPQGCWIWTASQNGHGYGSFVFEGKSWQAHRFAYESLVAPIPEGLYLDHLCRNRACVNPDHLEPVTHAENIRRGVLSRECCIRGHLFTPENTKIYKRHSSSSVSLSPERRCRECIRIRDRQYRLKKKMKRIKVPVAGEVGRYD